MDAVGGRVVARAGACPATSPPGARQVTCERSSARCGGRGRPGLCRRSAPLRSPRAAAPGNPPPRSGGDTALGQGTERCEDSSERPPQPRRLDAGGASRGISGGGARGAEPTKSLQSGIEEYTAARGGIGRGYLTPCASAAGACGAAARPAQQKILRAAAPRTRPGQQQARVRHRAEC